MSELLYPLNISTFSFYESAERVVEVVKRITLNRQNVTTVSIDLGNFGYTIFLRVDPTVPDNLPMVFCCLGISNLTLDISDAHRSQIEDMLGKLEHPYEASLSEEVGFSPLYGKHLYTLDLVTEPFVVSWLEVICNRLGYYPPCFYQYNVHRTTNSKFPNYRVSSQKLN